MILDSVHPSSLSFLWITWQFFSTRTQKNEAIFDFDSFLPSFYAARFGIIFDLWQGNSIWSQEMRLTAEIVLELWKVKSEKWDWPLPEDHWLEGKGGTKRGTWTSPGGWKFWRTLWRRMTKGTWMMLKSNQGFRGVARAADYDGPTILGPI